MELELYNDRLFLDGIMNIALISVECKLTYNVKLGTKATLYKGNKK